MITVPTSMSQIFFEGFPKEFGYKRMIVQDKSEMMDLVNRYNGLESIYTSIFRYSTWVTNGYGRPKPSYDTAIIPAIYFDLDEWETSYGDMLKTHLWCKERDIRHFVLFSGRGYHVFIFVKPFFNKPSDTMWSFSNYLEQKLQVDYDNTAKGNLAKISRVPNTYNIKRKAFCIPLTEYQVLYMDYNQHFKLAQSQQYVDPMIGSKQLDISVFEKETVFSRYKVKMDLAETEMKPDLEAAIESGILTTDSLPPCISNMLLNPTLNYDGRSSIVKFFTHHGYSYGETREILRNFLGMEKYKHALDTHLNTMFKNGFRRELSCNDLKVKGLCPACPRNSPFEYLL